MLGEISREFVNGGTALFAVRLSGRPMAHRLLSTAPARLAGLEKLETEHLEELLTLARQVLLKLFNTA